MVTEDAVKDILSYDDHKKRKWISYQSICHNGKVLYPGMRDIYERFNFIDPKDLKGKYILDFGCNVGMNCQVAIELGAKLAIGVDCEDHLIETAKKLNTLYKNNCHFAQVDLSIPLKTTKVDTGFVFAINCHVKNDKVLAENIKNNVKSVVYFETHVNRKHLSIPDEIENIFKEITLLGKTDKERRNFYKCIL